MWITFFDEDSRHNFQALVERVRSREGVTAFIELGSREASLAPGRTFIATLMSLPA
jgi:hypothetical protein